MSDERTHYDVIGVEPTASKADVKGAYTAALEAAQLAADAEETAAVRRAWQVLSDPVQRQRYDDEIGVTARRGPGSGTRTVDDALAGTDLEAGHDVHDGDDVHDGEVVDDLVPPPPRPGATLPPGAPSFLEQPGLGRRLTASLIDVVTLLALFLVSITVTFQLTGADTGAPGIITFVGWVEFWILVLFVIPTLRTGQTLGKRFTYTMTVDRETGNLPTVGQVIRRYMVPMVAIPALLQMGAFLSLFFGLSYAMGRDQLSLADRLAKTVVAIARYRPERPTRSSRSA